MANLKKKSPRVAQDRKEQSSAHLRDKVAVLESFVADGGVPMGYTWPGWEFESKVERLKENKVLVLSGTEAFRSWHDPEREFKVKGRTVHGVYRIGSPNTLSSSDGNKQLVATAMSHIRTLQKLKTVKTSGQVKDLKLQLKAKQDLLDDLANQIVIVGLENRKLKEKISRLNADIDRRDLDLAAARDEIRRLNNAIPLRLVREPKGDCE